jgi:hypothetical protein
MKVGDLVRGRPGKNDWDLRSFISSSPSLDAMVWHKIRTMEGHGAFSTKAEDTIQLWDAHKVFGMVVAINSGLDGYSFSVAQVLIGKQLFWFLAENLEPVR